MPIKNIFPRWSREAATVRRLSEAGRDYAAYLDASRQQGHNVRGETLLEMRQDVGWGRQGKGRWSKIKVKYLPARKLEMTHDEAILIEAAERYVLGELRLPLRDEFEEHNACDGGTKHEEPQEKKKQ
jgi:hypothetical protein